MDLTTPFILPRFGEYLPTRILPGPMEGVTTGEFLRVLTRHGWIRAWWTPFLRISVAVPRRARLQSWLSPYLECGVPVISQIMGIDTCKLARAARELRHLGAAAIDLNCACPSPIVVGNGAGGARLRHPGWMRETIHAIRSEVDCPVGIKLRIGFDSPEEFRESIAPAIRDASPDFVTIHFRTVREGYQRIEDGLERLAAARGLLPEIPLVGSGDLFDADSVRKMLEYCHVDAVAPARGLLRNPRLLVDVERALRNQPTDPWGDQEKHALLQEFQMKGSHLGFLLQMAANLFGRNSDDFRKTVEKLTAKP